MTKTPAALLTCLGLLALPLAACGSTETAVPAASGGATSPAGTSATVSCKYQTSAQKAAKTVDPPSTSGVAASGTTTATLTLADKPVVLTLDQAQTPCTTHNFVSLAQQGFFTETKCHRLTDAGIWVLQCGDPTATGTGGPGYAFADELASAKKLAASGAGSVVYPRGSVAMANSGPNTNGSQFFLVYKDSPLPPDYTYFGTIDEEGMKVVDQIAAQGVAADGTSPVAPAEISKVTLG